MIMPPNSSRYCPTIVSLPRRPGRCRSARSNRVRGLPWWGKQVDHEDDDREGAHEEPWQKPDQPYAVHAAHPSVSGTKCRDSRQASGARPRRRERRSHIRPHLAHLRTAYPPGAGGAKLRHRHNPFDDGPGGCFQALQEGLRIQADPDDHQHNRHQDHDFLQGQVCQMLFTAWVTSPNMTR